MITIQSAENALKNIYLESAINDINNKTNPFLTLVQKNAKTVQGKEARAIVRHANEGAIAMGHEGGELPVGKGGKVTEIVTDLKNLYGTFQITDKAIRAAQNNAGAFAGLISSEMKNLVDTAKNDLNSMLYGNGFKLLSYTEEMNTADKTFKVPAREVSKFRVGDQVKIMSVDNDELGTVTVSGISGDVITYTGTPTNKATDDRFYIYSAEDDNTQINGVDAIFRKDKMYNIDKASNLDLCPIVTCMSYSVANAPVAMKEADILEFMYRQLEHTGNDATDIILTHPTVQRAIHNELRTFRGNMDVHEFDAGFKGFKFGGKPVFVDTKCKAGTLYGLNSDSWAMHQLCDWTWMNGEEGGVLTQIDGKAGYSATLVKYADLLCDKPFLQGKVTNYSAKKFA